MSVATRMDFKMIFTSHGLDSDGSLLTIAMPGLSVPTKSGLSQVVLVSADIILHYQLGCSRVVQNLHRIANSKS